MTKTAINTLLDDWSADVDAHSRLPVRIIYDDSMGFNLSDAFAQFIEGFDETMGTVPLFITTDPNVRRRAGFLMPSEFVFSVFEMQNLPARLNQLCLMHPKGISKSDLRAFSIGAFRRYLYLDDDNHGRGELDISELNASRYENWEGTDSWPARYKTRFSESRATENDKVLSLYRTLFPNEIREAATKMASLSSTIAKRSGNSSRNATISFQNNEIAPDDEVVRAAEVFASVLPRRLGADLPFHQILENATMLLIDDRADIAAEDLARTLVPPLGSIYSGTAELLSKFFSIEPCRLAVEANAEDLGTVLRRVLPCKEPSCSDLRRFDLILLDLCLGEPPTAEPGGYQLLSALRRFFPDIPIIAFTRFGDIGHIEQAFAHGATWFLPKQEAWKLPEHYLERILDPNWWREWLLVRNRLTWKMTEPHQFDEKTLYLIWKAIESMPGGRIYVQELGGGIGGARTLHASREINGRYGRAAPVVIKIDERFRMLLERERYQRFIRPYLSNLAGRIEQPLARGGDNLAAISYTYAGASQGRDGSRRPGREVIPLENLLLRNLPKTLDDVSEARSFNRLFDALLVEILPRIHSVDPNSESSEVDYPNSIFEEFLNPLDSYLVRMPPEAVISVESPFSGEVKDCVNSKVSSFEELDLNQKLLAFIYDVEHGRDAYIKAVARLKDGNLHRVDLRGGLGAFYAENRHLRPMQPIVISIVRRPIDEECKAWQKLWGPIECTPKRKGPAKELACLGKIDPLLNICKHKFQTDGSSGTLSELGKVVVSLRRWLGGHQVMRSLRKGRIGIVHGDMNLGNVIVECQRSGPPKPVDESPWLIDFARTRRDRIVIDYTQMEVDLAMRLIRPEFFPSMRHDPGNWDDVEQFFSYFLEEPWKAPPVAKRCKRLRFIYEAMNRVRDAARENGVAEQEYISSRTLQLLITHKIMCGKWKKNPRDEALQFRCVLSLKLAFDCARHLGWDPAF